MPGTSHPHLANLHGLRPNGGVNVNDSGLAASASYEGRWNAGCAGGGSGGRSGSRLRGDSGVAVVAVEPEDDPVREILRIHKPGVGHNNGQLAFDPVLDLTPAVMDYQPGAEYGMLGMTFDPVDGRRGSG